MSLISKVFQLDSISAMDSATDFLMDRSGGVSHHPHPKHFGFSLN